MLEWRVEIGVDIIWEVWMFIIYFCRVSLVYIEDFCKWIYVLVLVFVFWILILKYKVFVNVDVWIFRKKSCMRFIFIFLL